MPLHYIGLGLLVIGGTTKLAIRTYRKIKKKEFFNAAGSRSFYMGAFENPMTRREAQLILGVRETSLPEEVRSRHRKLMVLNHPDQGGSTFLATKVNEAKDCLLK